MDIEKEWKEIAVKNQFELNAVLGSRYWDEINKNDLFLLKRKIGYATCGNPNEMPKPNNYYTGYSVDDLEMIKAISNQIISITDHDPILFACTFLIVYWDKAMSRIPVFRIVNSNGNVFVDTNGRVYNNWESFMDKNQLPKCSYCCPLNGEYTSEKNTLTLEFKESPACGTFNKTVDCIDTVATVTAIGATLGSLVFVAPVLVPVIGVASIYHAGRSAATLYDRNSHQQSIGLVDREARNAWLNIAGSAVGVGTAAAIGKAKQVVDSGKQLSNLTVFGMRALNVGSLVFSGFGFVDNLLLCKEKYMRGALTPLDVFHLSCEVLFFYNAIASVQATSNMLNQMSEVNMTKGSTEKLKLTKSQKRNLRRKISRQKAKLGKLNTNDEHPISKNISTSLGVGILYKIVKGFVPSAEELLYRYQSIGHDIECWINKEISIECLMKSLMIQLLNLHKEIMEDLNYMAKVIQNLMLKVKEYFHSASHDQQTQFCISVQNLENQIESAIRYFNEEVEELKDSNTDEEDAILMESSLEKSNDGSTEYVEQDQTDDEGISSESQKLFKKTEESIMSNFNCYNLEGYQYIIESVKTVLIEEYLDTLKQYKHTVNAAKFASSGFNLDSFNSAYGIEGDPGQYFYNQVLNTIDCRKLIRKIKNVHEKNCNEKCQDTNILEGKGNMYRFSGPKGKGKMTKEDILHMIVNKRKLNYLEEKSVEFVESEEGQDCYVLFIYSKDDSEIEIKRIIVYYQINEENTTWGLFNLYE